MYSLPRLLKGYVRVAHVFDDAPELPREAFEKEYKSKTLDLYDGVQNGHNERSSDMEALLVFRIIDEVNGKVMKGPNGDVETIKARYNL